MEDKQLISCEVTDGIAIVTVDNPPVNAMAPGVREGIIECVAQANADPAVEAVVLIGAGRHFIAGADMRRFGSARAVSTRHSAAAIEASAKPVVAAMQGFALGGGLEHALACHYRIAVPGAKLGLPEVTLGLVPGGGGTQRLTRLVGPQAAAEMIVSGRHVSAEEALRLGILDALVDTPVEGLSLRAAALRFAQHVATRRPLPRVRDRTDRIEPSEHGQQWRDAISKSIAAKSRHLKAPLAALACVEAALTMPFDEGVRFEERTFGELENSDEAKALRYAFFAEREAGKIPDAPADLEPERVQTAAVVGAGTMGSGIAICFADAGIPVKVLEATVEALDKGMTRIRETYASRVKRGSLSQQQMDQRLALIEPVDRYEAIGSCDAVIESVFERIDIKKDVFRRLDAVMKPGALLLTNSSAIDINVMAAETRRPEDVAGAHFFAPANVMKLCEIVRGDRSTMQTIVRATRLGRDLGKVSVVAGTCDGFAANRSRAPLVTEAMLLLEEGALPAQIDKVMVDFGYPMGPFAVSDLSGLDVSYDTRKRRAAADPAYRKLHVPDRMVELGRKGQKSGAGWYRYAAGDRTPIADDFVKEVIAGVARDFGITQRSFSDADILRRLLFASVNEACRIVAERKAWRASDIDVMWLNGFGFPRHRGGLMFWADTLGAREIHRQVTEWHTRYGTRWAPSPLLQHVAETGGLLREATARSRGDEHMTEPAIADAADRPCDPAVPLTSWLCVLCGFVYDEAAGMPQEGIPAGTRWADVPEDWVCPDCSARKSDFEMVEI